MINFFKGTIIDIILILFLIFSLMNNPVRYSNKEFYFKLTHNKATFSYYFIVVLLAVIIIYCKLLTFLDLSDTFSLSVPFFIILIFAITIIIIIYIKTERYDDPNTFSSPPKYMLSKKIRLVIHLSCLLLTCINLYLFMRYFSKGNDVNLSKLNYMLTNDIKKKKANHLILGLFLALILFQIIVIIQQYNFKPCKLNLPESWNF